MSNSGSDYEIGYGKPPKEGQFAKGKSGNPKGRPKGSKNFSSVVLKESKQPVRINGPRGTRIVTKLEAVIMQIGNKSAQGDLRASREFLSLVERSEAESAMQPKVNNIHEADQKTMLSLLERMKALPTNDNNQPEEGK